jgi:hypothetical protein
MKKIPSIFGYKPLINDDPVFSVKGTLDDLKSAMDSLPAFGNETIPISNVPEGQVISDRLWIQTDDALVALHIDTKDTSGFVRLLIKSGASQTTWTDVFRLFATKIQHSPATPKFTKVLTAELGAKGLAEGALLLRDEQGVPNIFLSGYQGTIRLGDMLNNGKTFGISASGITATIACGCKLKHGSINVLGSDDDPGTIGVFSDSTRRGVVLNGRITQSGFGSPCGCDADRPNPDGGEIVVYDERQQPSVVINGREGTAYIGRSDIAGYVMVGKDEDDSSFVELYRGHIRTGGGDGSGILAGSDGLRYWTTITNKSSHQMTHVALSAGNNVVVNKGPIGFLCRINMPVTDQSVRFGSVMVVDRTVTSDDLIVTPCKAEANQDVVGVLVYEAGVVVGGDAFGASDGIIAFSGIVDCKIDATSEPVAPGDLLVTSSSGIFGFARKARAEERAFAFARAMQRADGRGMIQVLLL